MADPYTFSHSVADQFRDAIAQKGMTPPDAIKADGLLHRFSSNGKQDDDAGWYVLHNDAIATGSFGDWRTGLTVNSWVADIGRELSPAEKIEFRKQQEKLKTQRDADNARRRDEAKSKAAGMLRSSKPAPNGHPYLLRKRVKAHGLRVWRDLLVIPMIDDSGEVQSLQLISPDGDKKFLAGGKMQGCYFPIGQIKSAGTILIAEGYATAATIHEATGLPIIVAYNAGNLLPVAQIIRAQNPNTSLVLCADDDWKSAGNPGMSKAREAAEAVGGTVIAPAFGDSRPDSTTDFNDMAAQLGKVAVTNFFTKHFLERKNSMAEISYNNDNDEQYAFFSRPGAAPQPEPLPEPPPTSGRVFTGTIIDFGPAPYKKNPNNSGSYFITVSNGDDEKTLWGVDLGKALGESGYTVGNKVAIYDKGKVPVQVVTKTRDATGKVIHEETKTVNKSAWYIGSFNEYIESRMQIAQEMAYEEPVRRPDANRVQRETTAAPKHPSAPDSAYRPAPELVAEPKLHFLDSDFRVIQDIWKNVPRQAARHSEAGYDILLDNKSKVRVTHDRIEMARKPKHRPDAAYVAACEHARQFWNSEVEVHGDIQHRIKTYAYAAAYGVKVTNYMPNDSELIEVNKIMDRLHKEAEPEFRRPNSQQARQSTVRLDA